MQEEFRRNEAVEKMTANLKVLRNKLDLTQDELAGKIGISRQTLVNIENRKRPMTWNAFVALIAVFRAESSTSSLLDHFEIYSAELEEYLTSPKNVRVE